MKQTFFLTLFSLSTFMTVCSGQIAILDYIPSSSNSCDAINKKILKLDRFTEVVKNTSAFHLEEKASALPSPGITVSNNKKKMLRDAKKKRTEYLAEHQKQGCETPILSTTVQRTDRAIVADSTPLSSTPRTMIENTPIKSTTKVPKSSVVHVEEKAAVVPVAKTTVRNNKEEMAIAAEKKDAERSSERQTYKVKTPVTAETVQMDDDKMMAPENAIFSSDKCNNLDIELIELSEFTNMVKNTSAFHLEEKASALPSPGFTVSNNKKKMLRDIKKKYAELLSERKKYGCESLTKE